jgi:hypothetical protein
MIQTRPPSISCASCRVKGKKRDQVRDELRKLVYPGQAQLGEVNPDRLRSLQDFYLSALSKATG